MSSFVDKLRMNSIYPSEGQNPNPFGPPSIGSGINLDEISNLMNRISPYITDENQKNRDFQLDMWKRQNPQLQNIGNQMANERINPIQQQQQQPMNNIINMPRGNPIDSVRGFPEQESFADRNNRANLGTINQQKIDQSQQKLTQGEEKIDISKHRAAVYEFKATHPNMVIKMPEGGNITAIDPQTGKSMDLGIPTGSLSDEDKIKLQQRGQQDVLQVKGQQQENLQTTRGNQALEQIGARIQGQQDVNAAKPIKTELPSQTKVRQFINARELAVSRPDLAQFIKTNPDGSFDVTPPTEGLFGHSGPTTAQYEEIKKGVFGTTNETKPSEIKKDEKKKNDPLGIR